MAQAQLPLFAEARGPVAPASPTPEVEAAARDLPADVRLGTSSWSFPGWAGLVYARAAAPRVLARHGLAAYARHPLLRCVGVDRTFYAPLAAEAFAGYAAAVPADFRFLVKAHERCTLGRFPRHRRHGADAGRVNPLYLDPGYARDAVVGPALEGLGVRLGAVVLQFPPQATGGADAARRFAERLHAFLGALPRGVLYAVEVRNPEWLSADYAAALAAAGAAHVLSVHPRLPDLAAQVRLAAAGDAPGVVVRWMLGGDRDYVAARERYAPFDRLVDPAPGVRDAIAHVCLAAARRGRPAYVAINNKAEGSAPRSALCLATRIGELVRGGA